MWLDKNQRGAGKPKDSRFISSNNNGGSGELGKNYAAVVSRRQMAPLGSPFSGGLDTFVLMSAPIQSSGQPLLTNHNPFTTTDKIYIILATKISSSVFVFPGIQTIWPILSRLTASTAWGSRWGQWTPPPCTTAWDIQVH